MTPAFQQLMKEATQHTRAGNLQAATAAIQAALGRGPVYPPPVDEPDDVIDVEAREVPDIVMPALEAWHHPAPIPVEAPNSRCDTPPATGQFITGSYADAAGRRDYKLFIPPGAGDHALPLIVMLHGCTQDPDDFAAGTAMNEAAMQHGFFVLYPAQSQKANPQRCWNWFKHNHQQRGRGEPSLLAGMTREVMARHTIDSRRIYVAGLSAGGAMAAIMGQAYPDLYAAVGIHSGLAAGAASDLPSALAAMKNGSPKARPGDSPHVPVIVFHGDSDATVHPRNGEQAAATSLGRTATVEVQHLAGGGKGGRASTRRVHRLPDGQVAAEHWVVHGAPHAWAGGSSKGSYTDSRGPDATAEMIRFFFEHPHR